MTSCVDSHLNRTDKSADIKFLDKVFDLVKKYYVETSTGKSKVIDFKLPSEIKSEIDFTLYDKSTDESKLLELCEKVLSTSVRCTHPFFFNQLFGGTHPYSLAGEFLTTVANGSMFTYEIAPVYSIMEKEVCLKLASFLGWDDTDSILAPGGSMCNLYGLLCARHKAFPSVKTKGIRGLPNMVILTSEHSHYSIGKFAILMGIGTDNVVKVNCDEDGRMSPKDLRLKILKLKEDSSNPICVVSTMGTTVLGAIDPIGAIADVCMEFGIWHHVDGCLAGPAVMLPELADDVKGIESIDSFSWDAHKLWTVPLQCAAFLVNPKHKGIMLEANSMNARYLFQQDKQNYDPSLDTGDKSIQCGRHIDVLKLWIWWKGKGTDGVREDSQLCVKHARLLGKMVEEREGFEMVFRVQFIQICFFYIPPGLRSLERNEDFYAKLDTVAAYIKSEMVKKGDVMIGYQRSHHPRNINYWRMVVSNPAITKADLVKVLDEIEELGKRMFS
ncbi:glutamate decarboxylase 2 [Oopsacas minuta]|uniref:Glutamate decarboxylase 2 n=1 Tax=Oopsacas minuta TaxID=111878 RepID=A0AAV7JWM5_9METZ|nr:glutamate decarboxylase 2 [Oopsacas minuta]